MEIGIRRTHLPSGLIAQRQRCRNPCCYNLSLSDHFAHETGNIQAGLGKLGFGWRNTAPLCPPA
jgi:hypothetical protein